MNIYALHDLALATWQTIYMVFISSFLSVVVGLALGIILFLTQRNTLFTSQAVNKVVGTIVNILRSVPFIILMIAIIPLTRFIVGTTIGTNAAIVSLTLAAIPFYARVAESAIKEVPNGLIEATTTMGATTWQIVYKVLIPESLPGLIRGATLTIIGLIGYSAMAGAIGGGGLGELAINYGYQRFDITVMIETVVILVVLVQFIQSYGDHLAKTCKLKTLAIASALLWVVCITTQIWPSIENPRNTIKVGVMAGVMQHIMDVAGEVAQKDYNINLVAIPFNDYTLPNIALNNGNIDANIFQHVPYLKIQLKAHPSYHLKAIAKTFVYPMGFYSRKIVHLSQLKFGAIVAVPNDPSNEGRALLLLQKYHLIKLDHRSGLFPSLHDIVKNPEHLQFKALAAAQLPRVLKDASLVALTNDFVGPAGFKVNEAIIKEGADSAYANVIVARRNDRNPLLGKLIEIMHSQAVIEATMKAYPHGAAIKAW